MGQVVGHLDADCFYCSAERVRYPHLIGVPLAVIGNQGACVIARSYEMRKSKIGVGVPIWDAIRLCPEGIYLKRDFRWYEVLSRAMLDIVREFSPRVQYYSIDEFFFEATPSTGEDHATYGRRMRDAILERVGVPVTVGIARSRTLAKLISDSAKPFGASAVLDTDAERQLLGSLPVTEISGISGRREAILSPRGIRTCLDLSEADRGLIRKLLTASGEALWWELNGHPVTPIHAVRPPHKRISRGGSFGESSALPSVIWGWAVRNLERLIEELRYHQQLTGRVSVYLGYRDRGWGVGHARIITPSDRFDLLLDTIRPCVRKAWRRGAEANRMHLFADDLRVRSDGQLGLYPDDTAKGDAMERVKQEINARHGRFTVRSAATLALHGVYEDESNNYDICDVRGKTCF